jgi:hypothetical protein
MPGSTWLLHSNLECDFIETYHVIWTSLRLTTGKKGY